MTSVWALIDPPAVNVVITMDIFRLFSGDVKLM